MVQLQFEESYSVLMGQPAGKWRREVKPAFYCCLDEICKATLENLGVAKDSAIALIECWSISSLMRNLVTIWFWQFGNLAI